MLEKKFKLIKRKTGWFRLRERFHFRPTPGRRWPMLRHSEWDPLFVHRLSFHTKLSDNFLMFANILTFLRASFFGKNSQSLEPNGSTNVVQRVQFPYKLLVDRELLSNVVKSEKRQKASKVADSLFKAKEMNTVGGIIRRLMDSKKRFRLELLAYFWWIPNSENLANKLN